jgi:endoglucanase
MKLKSYLPTANLLLASALSIVMMSGCAKQLAPKTNHADYVLLNQVGFTPAANKIALLKVKTPSFQLVDTTGKVMMTGTPAAMQYWEYSGDSVAIADFSSFNQAGTYFLVVNDSITSYPIHISNIPLAAAGAAAIKALYFNRTAMPITAQYGGKWARAAGHPDTVVYIHESAATKKKPAGTIISSPGGWFDAGDYNKYVVNSGITTYTLLKALEDYTGYFKTLNLNIPESGNQLPDLLDETLYNLRWVMTMQDSDDGGVYHKLTNKGFDAFIMPDKATEPRYVVQKSTAAALDYAALLAKAARVIKPWEQYLPGLADSCQTRAIAAWKWAEKNPNILFISLPDIHTGNYDDRILIDEKYWAASELWLLTGDAAYIPSITANYKAWGVPTWGYPGTLGTLSLLDNYDKLPVEIKNLKVKEEYIMSVDSLLSDELTSPFKVSIKRFAWGSNSDVANMGVMKLYAYKLTGDAKYLLSAQNDADYLMGRNAAGYCFETGFGSKPVMNIHYRPTGADSIKEPVPGFLAGGPNLVVLTDCGDRVKRSPFPAKSYVDEECSYSTNEIAINWNAPLAYLLNGLAASSK